MLFVCKCVKVVIVLDSLAHRVVPLVIDARAFNNYNS